MISLYTTCKGRLYHLKKTLLPNIESIKKVPGAEIVVLDYASPDELTSWMEENWDKFNGVVNYWQYSVPGYFHIAHAKNLGATVCKNDIICSVDADMYIEESLVDQLLDLKKFHFLASTGISEIKESWGCIGCWKEDFILVNGYDERCTGYGYDDVDFCKKMCKIGMNRVMLKDDVLKVIYHTDKERVAFYENKTTMVNSRANKAMILSSDRSSVSWGNATLLNNFHNNVVVSNGCKRNVKIWA